MIDERELMEAIEPIKTVAKLPAVGDNSKYTMVVPYVELVKVIKEVLEMTGGENNDTKAEIGQQGL